MKTKNDTPEVHLYHVELAICTGWSAPIPVLPAMPHYRFFIVGPPESKRKATARMRALCERNHGYRFGVAAEAK